ncbi:unnamed protein product [Leptosia nina]|uniref:Uncharacterized protein n=1 Tax=Leptosia nina TaxID=320188 RepID=A0AAV1J2U2_9NEOP
MNSIDGDCTRDYLASEAARQVENLNITFKNVSSLHKELLEINISVKAYIEESKKRLSHLRLQAANNAKSAQEVAEVLSKN